MSWPLASHFSAMLQNPRVAFRDEGLRRSVVEKDSRNQPRPWAGAFAVVYKAIDPTRNEPFAIRIFTSESPERRERYEMMSAYLSGRKLRCLCEFEYRDRSIRSAGDGKWYPLILMEWVQGETLFKWVRERCLEGDAASLARVAERWVEVVRELADARIAHGDLQHANIMVTDAGEVKLVDYDCMCVPALVGRRNLEVGVDPYQHPGRNERTLLSLDLDHFSSLMIYVALRALAAAPWLWQKHVEQTGYDKLLIRREDLQSPATSALYADLMQLPDGELRDLTSQFFALVRVPIDQVPPLGQLANNYAKIEDLLIHRRWQEAVDLLNRRGNFRDAPSHLKLLINQAYEQVCRQKAWEEFRKIPWDISEANDRRLSDAWNEKLFAGFEPAEKERVRVGEARHRVSMLERLRYLVQQLATLTYAGEQSVAEAASHLPAGYPHSLAKRVDEARQRVAALGRFERVIHAPPAEAAVVAAWRAVVESGCEALIDPTHRLRIEQAERRAPLLRRLADLPGDLSPAARDRRLLEIWDAPLLANVPEADRWRSAYETAARRQSLLRQLHDAVVRGDGRAMAAVMDDRAMTDYPLPPQLAVPAREAHQRAAAMREMVEVMRRGERAYFPAVFDVRAVRAYPAEFEPHRDLLRQWIIAELLPPEAIGLAPSPEGGIEPADEVDGPACRLRWTWPEGRFTAKCRVAICAQRPPLEQAFHDGDVLFLTAVERAEWEAAGGSWRLRVDPAWRDAYVVVAAVIDCGFESFVSRPVVIGTLGGNRWWNWRRWKLFGRDAPARASGG